MTTHVSIGGMLYRTAGPLQGELPSGARSLGVGRLVRPNGNYAGKPYVTLYRIPATRHTIEENRHA